MIFYTEDDITFMLLSIKERGQLITAMLDEHNGRPVTTIEGRLVRLWPNFKDKVAAGRENYERVCERNRNNGRKNRPRGIPVEPSGIPVEPSGIPMEPSGIPMEPSGIQTEPSGIPVGGELELELELKKKKNTSSKKVSSDSEVSWDPDSGFAVSPELVAEWARMYGVDVSGELDRMHEWVLDNPGKRKKNWRRFVAGWLARERKGGGTGFGGGEMCGRGRSAAPGERPDRPPPSLMEGLTV